MEYAAHIKSDGSIQTVKEHCENTALLCRSFAIEELKELCFEVGLMHDVGKYLIKFQQRILGDYGIRVEHSVCGAKEVYEKYKETPMGLLMALCIAGHHSGIPDCGTVADSKDEKTLFGRLKRECEDYSAYKDDISISKLDERAFNEYLLKGCKEKDELVEKYAFLVRYCFSCLTDADSIDTMRATDTYREMPFESDFDKCTEKLENRFKLFEDRNVTDLQKARSCLQSKIFEKADEDADIYLMNMPTGSGKTLASMYFALKRARLTGKERIIYVIPYNSIIDQTVKTFEELFGDSAKILRHQSSFSYEDSDDYDEDYRNAAIQAEENWDAKIIVTTSVQFFESVYANNRQKLRKLHNTANSIIIFDEAHRMPVENLQPCLRAVSFITRFLHSEAIFLTATMPDFGELLRKYSLPDTEISELRADKKIAEVFKKNTYKDIGKITDESLAAAAGASPSALIVVNSRRAARSVYDKCAGKKYHLSTYMTSVDRSRTISEIKAEIGKLRKKYPCGGDIPEDDRITVVSTSLIEAGVDLDFDDVYREAAGLDNILQAGGRCNREGARENGNVYVFERADGKGKQSIEQNIMRGIFNEFRDISSSEAIRAYYDRLFAAKKDEIVQNSLGNICRSIDLIPFRSYRISIIDSIAVSVVVVQDDECAELVKNLEINGHTDIRRLRKYCCSVYPSELESLKKQGVIKDYNGISVLTANNYYDSETGIEFEGEDIYI